MLASVFCNVPMSDLYSYTCKCLCLRWCIGTTFCYAKTHHPSIPFTHCYDGIYYIIISLIYMINIAYNRYLDISYNCGCFRWDVGTMER